jgi:hypothetical protein
MVSITDVPVEIVVGFDGSATLQEAGRNGSLTPYVQASVHIQNPAMRSGTVMMHLHI